MTKKGKKYVVICPRRQIVQERSHLLKISATPTKQKHALFKIDSRLMLWCIFTSWYGHDRSRFGHYSRRASHSEQSTGFNRFCMFHTVSFYASTLASLTKNYRVGAIMCIANLVRNTETGIGLQRVLWLPVTTPNAVALQLTAFANYFTSVCQAQECDGLQFSLS